MLENLTVLDYEPKYESYEEYQDRMNYEFDREMED